MARGSLSGVGTGYSGDLAGDRDPTDPPAAYSLNHRSPSRTTIDSGRQPGLSPSENSVTTPAGVIRPDPAHMGFGEPQIPSGPDMMPSGPAPAVGSANSVIAPRGVIRAIWLGRRSRRTTDFRRARR